MKSNVEALLATLLWLTLAAAAIGLLGALFVAARRDGRAVWLLIPFAGLAAHQGIRLPGVAGADLGLDADVVQAGALLLIALGALLGLAAFARVARERNAAEEMHWDAMEALRSVNELPAAGSPRDVLEALLAIGARQFGAAFAAVLPPGEGAPAAVHVDQGLEIDAEAAVAVLRTYAGRSCDRPLLDESPAGDHPLRLTRVFCCQLRHGGQTCGLLAFAGLSRKLRKLTATDKDLLSLLAQRATQAMQPDAKVSRKRTPSAARRGAARGSERPARPQVPHPTRARGKADTAQPGSVAEQLRAGLGDEKVALAPTPELERAGSSPVPIEQVARGLTRGVRRVSAEGELRIEVETLRSPQGNGEFLALTVRVEDPSLDASALNGVASRGSTSIEALGERLREHGGDISISVEAGVGASMTAYLPVEDAPDSGSAARDPAPHYAS